MSEMAKKVMKILKEVERKGLKLSVTDDAKEGKSKMIASCGFLEDELRVNSVEKKESQWPTVWTPWVDLRTRVKKLGAKEKARRKKCGVGFSLIKKNKVFSKEFYESGCQKVAACGHDASKHLVSPCVGDGSNGEVEIEATDGSSSRQKEALPKPSGGGI